MSATYSITDSFIAGGSGVNGLTVNAYLASRFTTPPTLNAAAPSGTPDATATTGTSYGNDGSFQLSGLAAGQYWVGITYSSTTYWKLYNLGGTPFGAMLYGSGSPAPSLGNVGDQYTDTTTGNVYGPKVFIANPTFVGEASSSSGSVVVPSAVESGDLLIMVGAGYSSTAVNPVSTAGWTELHFVNGKTSVNPNYHVWIVYKFASSTDAGSTVSLGESYSVLSLVAYRGVGGTAPTIINSTDDAGVVSGSDGTVTYPAFTFPGSGLAVVAAAWCQNSSSSPAWSSVTAPSGSTLRASLANATPGICAVAEVTSGATGTFTFVNSGTPVVNADTVAVLSVTNTAWPAEGEPRSSGVPAYSSAPSSPAVGQSYYDTTLDCERVWTGWEWRNKTASTVARGLWQTTGTPTKWDNGAAFVVPSSVAVPTVNVTTAGQMELSGTQTSTGSLPLLVDTTRTLCDNMVIEAVYEGLQSSSDHPYRFIIPLYNTDTDYWFLDLTSGLYHYSGSYTHESTFAPVLTVGDVWKVKLQPTVSAGAQQVTILVYQNGNLMLEYGPVGASGSNYTKCGIGDPQSIYGAVVISDTNLMR